MPIGRVSILCLHTYRQLYPCFTVYQRIACPTSNNLGIWSYWTRAWSGQRCTSIELYSNEVSLLSGVPREKDDTVSGNTGNYAFPCRFKAPTPTRGRIPLATRWSRAGQNIITGGMPCSARSHDTVLWYQKTYFCCKNDETYSFQETAEHMNSLARCPFLSFRTAFVTLLYVERLQRLGG